MRAVGNKLSGSVQLLFVSDPKFVMDVRLGYKNAKNIGAAVREHIYIYSSVQSRL